MIVLFKNHKIIGVDNNLLNLLNADLDNLSSKISELELILSTIQQNNFTLGAYSFTVEEIPLISLEDIKAYNLIQTNQNEVETFTKPSDLDEFIKIETPHAAEETPINIEPIQIEEPVIKHHEETIPSESLNQTEFQLNINTPTESIQENKIEPVPTEQEIKISFETSNEIDEILSLNKEETNKLITEELHKAAKDLEIDFQTIYQLYMDLLTQIKEAKKSFDESINNKDYEKLHQIAHKLKGAALNLRLSKLALILKQIDEDSKDKKPIEEIDFLIEKFYDFVDKLDTKKSEKIPESIKKLILITIQDYLDTQNEKKFKKDIRYIEKLLKTKIDSLEDLQQLIKE